MISYSPPRSIRSKWKPSDPDKTGTGTLARGLICETKADAREQGLILPNVARKQSTTAFQGRRFSCEAPIRVVSPEFTLRAIWRTDVRSGFTPQSTALEGRRTGEICNCEVLFGTSHAR